MAVLHKDMTTRAIVGILICPCSLSPFQYHCIVVHADVTAIHQDIPAHINVECITARCLGISRLVRSIDGTVQVPHLLTLVEVIRPEGTIDQMNILYRHILTMGDIHQSWTQSLQVSTFTVELAPNPEFLPETQSIAIDCPCARNRKTIDSIGIDKSCKIVECLSFHTSFNQGIMLDGIDTFQHTTLGDMQVSTLLKEQRTRKECSTGYHYHASTQLCRLVDHGLYFRCLQEGGIVFHSVVGNHILSAQCIHIYLGSILEPRGDGRSIRPVLNSLLSLGIHR